MAAGGDVRPQRVLAAWPAFAGLGLLGLMAIANVVFDVLVARDTAVLTTHLLDNALRSIELANDLRFQAHRLAEAADDRGQLAAIAQRLENDARDYDPLATEEGEREEFDRLRVLLGKLRAEGDGAAIPGIEASISHLVAINEQAAQRNGQAIRSSSERMVITDVAAGALTVASGIAIAIVLLRSGRRQRELLRLHLTSLDERQRDLEAFAARASHDLKGPLSPLRGYADLLSMHEAPQVREVALRIRRSSDKMSAIVDDLLALSMAGRPQAGQVAIAGVVLELVQELASSLEDAEVAVDVGDLAVECSEGVLGQIARNLLSNAIKYRARDRRLVVRVSAARVDGWIELVVADNGIGMDHETSARAFEPFFRAPSASTPGHGLGLSIVKRAAEAHGGEIALTSTAGEGTRVTVRLRPAAQ